MKRETAFVGWRFNLSISSTEAVTDLSKFAKGLRFKRHGRRPDVRDVSVRHSFNYTRELFRDRPVFTDGSVNEHQTLQHAEILSCKIFIY
jgi:hypothetical protein